MLYCIIGKVSSLKLIVDGGQLQESDGVPVKTKSLALRYK